MSSLRTSFRAAIALFGLIAVFMGALEHEDLILQGQPAADIASSEPWISTPAEAPTAHSESGAESDFRQETDHYWTVSERPAHAIIQRVLPRERQSWALICPQRPASRAPAAGIVALRL